MKAQEAARRILKERGTPLTSDEIAEIALSRDLVTSRAKEPVRSIASTLEKNIRDGIYNDPRLVFIETNHGRLIGLPGMNGAQAGDRTNGAGDRGRLEVSVPRNLLEKLHLASQAGIADDFPETVTMILQKGLREVRDEVKAGLLKKLESI